MRILLKIFKQERKFLSSNPSLQDKNKKYDSSSENENFSVDILKNIDIFDFRKLISISIRKFWAQLSHTNNSDTRYSSGKARVAKNVTQAIVSIEAPI